MNISNTNPVLGNIPVYTSPTPLSVHPSQTDSAINSTADNEKQASADIEKQYEAAIQQLALSFKDSYPLGDQTFTLYKDITGQYITRYVSLRDGTVTYVPEPVLVRQASSTPSVSINA